ncbi:hypothetical protein V8C44DRAFT_327281 [Trichoderma aethiopicum]
MDQTRMHPDDFVTLHDSVPALLGSFSSLSSPQLSSSDASNADAGFLFARSPMTDEKRLTLGAALACRPSRSPAIRWDLDDEPRARVAVCRLATPLASR